MESLTRQGQTTRSVTLKQIPVAAPTFNGNEKKYLEECIDSTRVSATGRFIDEFERQFAEFCETKHALTCSNGTVALHLALLAHGVGEGDEVIVPSLTYIASANAVMYCGAKPVFIDSDKDTWNLDPLLLERAITPRTKGIIVVHLYGHPADMDAIMDAARRHNLFVIEDAAEAHGALYKGQKAGSIGHCSTFSFFGNKIITCGEGGAIVTNDDELASRMRLLKGQGMDPNRRYWFNIIGYNYRMTNMQAAVALAQLEQIEWHQAQRRRVAEIYNKALSPLADEIVSQSEKPWATHAHWMFSIILRRGNAHKRDWLMQQLANDGIETRPVFYPLHTMPPYEELHRTTVAERNGSSSDLDLPFAKFIAARGINLPTFAELEDSDIMHIVSRLQEHLKVIPT